MRRSKVLKEKEGEEEEFSASMIDNQEQEGSLPVQPKIGKNGERFSSDSGEEEDEEQEKNLSSSGEDSLNDLDQCSSSVEGGDQNLSVKEPQRRHQYDAWDTRGTLRAENVGLHQDDAIRNQTPDDVEENDNIVHLEDRESDLSDGDEEENASEKVEPLEWMFTRREVEKGTIEIVYRWS